MTMSMNNGDVNKHFRFENMDLIIDKETDDLVSLIKWKIVSVTKATENWNPHILLMGMSTFSTGCTI